MPEFHETVMGKRFYEGQVPRIAKALEDIGKELKRQNDSKLCSCSSDAKQPVIVPEQNDT